jgi:predicted house-cleaning noncanonical NTP pyrophosphatase (MazG superfamily)
MAEHNKLVRDKIPDIIAANGQTAHIRIIEDDAEYLAALCDKLGEESAEVKDIPSLEELADTLEVVHAIGKALGHTPEDIETARALKAEARGGFEKRIFLTGTQ